MAFKIEVIPTIVNEEFEAKVINLAIKVNVSTLINALKESDLLLKINIVKKNAGEKDDEFYEFVQIFRDVDNKFIDIYTPINGKESNYKDIDCSVEAMLISKLG